jgi:DnaK suppressor protein
MKAKSKPRPAAKAKAASPPPKATVQSKSPKGATANLRTDALRKILLERRQAVMKEIEGQIGERISDETHRRIDSAPDLGDQALLDSERGRDISIMEMRNRVRQQIDEALARLEEGTYGLCSDCGVEISEKRLLAVPFARRCVACQEKEEMLEKIEQEEEQTP